MNEMTILSTTVLDLYEQNTRNVILPTKVFGQEMNNTLLKKIIVFYQQANKRSSSASTKNKSSVHGSGRKMRAQKGTGHARMGSKNMPHHRGGAVTFGPNSRQYDRSSNKKERLLALFIALSEKFRSGNLVILENLELKEIKTKSAMKTLAKFNLQNRSLFIDSEPSKEFILSTRNLFYIDFLNVLGLNAFSVMAAKKLFMTSAALNHLVEKYA